MVALIGTSLQIERGADRPTDRQCHEKKKEKMDALRTFLASFPGLAKLQL